MVDDLSSPICMVYLNIVHRMRQKTHIVSRQLLSPSNVQIRAHSKVRGIVVFSISILYSDGATSQITPINQFA